MSGPKGSSYSIEQQRRAEMERKERERQQREAERERKRLEEERERQRKIEEEVRRKCKALEEQSKSMQKALASSLQTIEQEQKRQQERAKALTASVSKVEIKRESVIDADALSKTVDFSELMEQVKKDMEVPEENREELEAFVEELLREQSQPHSLVDAYLADVPEQPEEMIEKTPEIQEFEQLLFSMEEEYKEIVSDRAFFRYHKDRIIRFEEVCKRQQEYRSYPILREVYYGEFTKIKKARDKWHKKYETWKEPFEEAYIQYRAMCNIMGRKPEHYYLNPETVEEDIKALNEKTEKLREENMCMQESLEITKIFNEVMEEMGYQVLATKDIKKKSGGKVQNTVFSYGEGSGIHVMDSGSRITMEIVGLDDGNGSITEEDKEYLEDEQVHFCESFHEIEKELTKRGVVLNQRIRMLPPSKEYSTIMDMEGYTVTEHKSKTKSLSKVDKKAKKKQQGKKYISEQ